MKYIKDISIYTHEVKQSKFIAHLLPYNDCVIELEKLKKEHPKARHFVTAYRHLNKYEQVVEHSNDDGEPKGTSGKPSLIVLQGQNIINAGVIIVRYFGGTKLGTGGLVRAYSDAVNHVIKKSELFEYKKELEKLVEIEYSNIRLVEYECELSEIKILEKSFEKNSKYRIKAEQKTLEAFLEKLDRVIKVVE